MCIYVCICGGGCVYIFVYCSRIGFQKWIVELMYIMNVLLDFFQKGGINFNFFKVGSEYFLE